MAVAFSTDSSTVFQRGIDVSIINQDKKVLSLSQLDICKSWICSAGYKRVALQFPDEYLHRASEVAHILEKEVEGLQLFVLADTSYGSCCVDEVAAEHGSADCVLHVGHSCLSPTRRLPVMYMFGEANVDVEQCCDKIKDCLKEENLVNVALVYDVTVHHCIGAIHKKLEKDFPGIILSHLDLESNARICSNTEEETVVNKELLNCVTCGGRNLYLQQDKSVADYTILYIGPESMTLTNLMMTWNKCPFYRYDPMEQSVRKESANVNKLLMKRYFLVEKAKDAQIVGILVGTLGVANYLEIIQKMKNLLKKAGKKYYTFVVGKLNVAKLANFMEIDVYVYISCAENTLVDSKDFYRPVVTPYEMEIACNPEQQWTGEYVMEFQQLLPGGQSYVSVPEENVEEHADVSLITGGVRHLGVKDTGSAGAQSAQTMVERGDNMQVANTAGEFLSNRSWRGLEPELGKTPVVKATKGRKGIAIEYENEPT